MKKHSKRRHYFWWITMPLLLAVAFITKKYSKRHRYFWQTAMLVLFVITFASIVIVFIRSDNKNASAALVVNTNEASIKAMENLKKTTANLQASFDRISSGLRINSASDDAAGLGVQEELEELLDEESGSSNESRLELDEGSDLDSEQELESLQRLINSTSYLAEVLKMTDNTEIQLRTVLMRVANLANSTSSNRKKNYEATLNSITRLSELDKQLSNAYSQRDESELVAEIDGFDALFADQRQIITAVIKASTDFSKLTPKRMTAEKNKILSLLDKKIKFYSTTKQNLIDVIYEVRTLADDEVEYARDF